MGRNGKRRSKARKEKRKEQLIKQPKVEIIKTQIGEKFISKQTPVSFKPKRAPRYI
ncbi:hypothetical protein HS141_11280 [Cetobacterium somerae]|uniref:hypothetical protein n=1 Tax=Cetobacterium TaxID=180162 RepID=UPI00211DE07A|nr:hypothetical protein [Cetobacterium somerae]MCQ9627513.1 hypothetical protein [Cetobacterium somerae]